MPPSPPPPNPIPPEEEGARPRAEERLDVLRTQRAAIAAHLRWLDSEIARAEGAAAPTTAPGPLPAPGTFPPVPSASGGVPELSFPSDSLRRQKLGCVAIALLIIAAALFVVFILPGMIYE
ncbi:MAG: hypothetical protein ACLFR7_09590 [Opitutales bacterium]